MKKRITIVFYPDKNDPEKYSDKIHSIEISLKFLKWWIPVYRYIVPLKY